MVIVLTGDGKGKTTSAIGTALRAIQHKKKVLILHFFKNKEWYKSGEIVFLSNLLKERKNLMVQTFGTKGWVDIKKPSLKDKRTVEDGLEFLYDYLKNNKPFLVVLDELLFALKIKIIEEKQLIEIIKNFKKKEIHLIITGRFATKKTLKEADLVTEMKNIKHPYQNGYKAIEGIDF